jgi:uncharacterized protein YaeQ
VVEIYRLVVNVSDVDRGVYEALDLRLARHPSETMRYLTTRALAYCLSYEEGIEFSKGGLSSTDEPPISVRDRTGVLQAWIDLGAPSAERLHKASKAARRVALFTTADLPLLRKEARSRTVHAVESIEVWPLERTFVDALESRLDRSSQLELTRSEGRLYVTAAGDTLETSLERTSLVDP